MLSLIVPVLGADLAGLALQQLRSTAGERLLMTAAPASPRAGVPAEELSR